MVGESEYLAEMSEFNQNFAPAAKHAVISRSDERLQCDSNVYANFRRS
jgi:hypothetical protein